MRRSPRRAYDDLNRLTGIVHRDSANLLLASYDYALLADGTRAAVTEKRLEGDGSTSTTLTDWDYDALGRLVREAYDSSLAGQDYTADYTYDLVGNILKDVAARENGDIERTEYDYNELDQLFADEKPRIGLLFDATWEEEHGLGVLIENLKVTEAGHADVALFV